MNTISITFKYEIGSEHYWSKNGEVLTLQGIKYEAWKHEVGLS